MTFSELGLAEPILRAVADEGYTLPTPIQKQAIPHVLDGQDLLGCAQTGTGKTAAFALPILDNLLQDPPGRIRYLRVLVLTPTRELAQQITDSFQTYGRFTKLRQTVIFGGVSDKPQIEALRKGVDILVATPGRLCDLLNQRAVNLSDIDTFVLDEADRMLDMGFLPDVKRIVAKLPTDRQTLFFSATMPPEIEKLANELLFEPVSVKVAPAKATADLISQSVYFVAKKQKPLLLADFLLSQSYSRALVFTRTKHGADRVVKQLSRAGIKAEAIHGNKSQSNRTRTLENFKGNKTSVLVATDIAARGIDVDGISHVLNFDLPNEPETYVHRIGRTGRAGASGIAVSFCDDEERPYLSAIEKLIRRKITKGEPIPETAPRQPAEAQRYKKPLRLRPTTTPPAPRDEQGDDEADYNRLPYGRRTPRPQAKTQVPKTQQQPRTQPRTQQRDQLAGQPPTGRPSRPPHPRKPTGKPSGQRRGKRGRRGPHRAG